jgi:hypothetical protein
MIHVILNGKVDDATGKIAHIPTSKRVEMIRAVPPPVPVLQVAVVKTEIRPWDLVFSHRDQPLDWLSRVPSSCRFVYVYHRSGFPGGALHYGVSHEKVKDIVWISCVKKQDDVAEFVDVMLSHSTEIKEERRLALPTDTSVFVKLNGYNEPDILDACLKVHQTGELTFPRRVIQTAHSLHTQAAHAWITGRLCPSVDYSLVADGVLSVSNDRILCFERCVAWNRVSGAELLFVLCCLIDSNTML